ncbi:hypothetical protein BJ912DRAFT_1059500 [Pholiota molesta]|nr:hypothetical protein BJ912DRAFT_1059500 [Pholiota molesta]
MSSDTRPIPLRVANKTAYVWDVDDIATIRSKYRICGVLTGTLPHLSQQNVFLGVPLVLLPEEAALLVDIGAAVLVDDPTAHKQPTIPQLERWSAGQQESIKTQLSYNETKVAKESLSGRAMSEDAVRKRKEREERKRAQAAAKAAAEATEEGSSSVFVPSEPETKPPPPTEPVSSPTDLLKNSSVPYTIVIPASSSSLEWYDASGCSTRAMWCLKDLWKQGYFMGGGIKFGGEYLVYPGDPLRYHSHFAASVIESPIASLRPMEIVAHGRLGTATKKAHLLCGWDDEKKEVSYLSIEWAGFG